jgi:hypothetical protein
LPYPDPIAWWVFATEAARLLDCDTIQERL